MGCEQSLSVNKTRERKQKQGVSREDAWLRVAYGFILVFCVRSEKNKVVGLRISCSLAFFFFFKCISNSSTEPQK